MAQYSTPQELQKAIMHDLSGVVIGVTEHYLGVLKKNVDDEVYQNPDQKPAVYKRTGEFLNSWILDILSTTKENEFGMRIYSDPDLMVYDPEKSQHGSPDGSEDRRDLMTEAILLGILWDYETDADVDWWMLSDTRDFWTPTIKEMDDSFHKTVVEAFKNIENNIQIV